MVNAHIRYETNELRLLFEVSQVLEGASELSEQLAAALALIARYTGMMRGAGFAHCPRGAHSRGVSIHAQCGYGRKPPLAKYGARPS